MSFHRPASRQCVRSNRFGSPGRLQTLFKANDLTALALTDSRVRAGRKAEALCEPDRDQLDTAGHETVLYTFTGGADGGWPYVGVMRDPAGNLYGTATYGGTAGAGVVFKLDTAGQEAVLYSFTGGADGGGPVGVIRDSAGNLYGTTVNGGTAGWGVVYKIPPAMRRYCTASRAGPMGGIPTAV